MTHLSAWRRPRGTASPVTGQSVPYITADKLGAPQGVATLDTNAKVPRNQMQMAAETEAAIEELQAAVDAIATGEAESGDGIRVVGDTINIDISSLTLAP